MDWLFGLFLMVIGQAGVLCMCDRDLCRSWDDWVINIVASLGLGFYALGFLVFRSDEPRMTY